MTRKRPTRVAQHTDAEIFTAARHALAQMPEVPSDLHVHVDHGYVTLTGSVRWATEAEIAERTIRHLPGVQGVINSVVVVHVPSAMGYEAPE
jgi:osmotically-inducible protein OsmY